MKAFRWAETLAGVMAYWKVAYLVEWKGEWLVGRTVVWSVDKLA